MPKQLKISSNQRLDKDDLIYGTSTYPSSLQKHFIERIGIDNFSRIIEGFRVEVSGLNVTIRNGVGFDRNGQIVNDEDTFSKAVTTTLGAGPTTYFIEVYFKLAAGDGEDRAFWDATYNNGADVSGDIKPYGKEFSTQVNTRYTPTWDLYSPISTAAFNYIADPNTIRIPIAIVYTNAGSITTTTVVPRTLLKEDTTAATTSIKCFNVREFPDATGYKVRIYKVGDDTTYLEKTVTSIDKENGTLTFTGIGAGFANYRAGARVALYSGATVNLIPERRTGAIPYATGASADARPRYFQRDEEVGFGAAQDPYNNPGRSDLAVNSEKIDKDYISALIREIKFGGMRGVDVGNLAPPSTFTAVPRYFDPSPGILGAKTNTVSIGDGVNSFGDFNTTTSGSTVAAFTSAISACGYGGTIFLKKGTYSVASTINITSSVYIVGEDRDTTVIKATGAVPALRFDVLGGNFYIENITVKCDASSTATKSLVVNDCFNFYANNCTINGFYSVYTSSGILKGCFNNCTINTIPTGSCVYGAYFSYGTNISFIGCDFTTTTPGSSARCLFMEGTTKGFSFYKCTFKDVEDATALIELSGTPSGYIFDGCTFDGVSADAQTKAVLSIVAASNLTFDKCVSNCGAGLFSSSDTVSGLTIDKSYIAVYGNASSDAYGVSFGNASVSNRIKISKCLFSAVAQGSADKLTYGIFAQKLSGLNITDTTFQSFDHGISDSDTPGSDWDAVSIIGSSFLGDTGVGVTGITLNNGFVKNTSIHACLFSGLNKASSAIRGVKITGTDAKQNISISKCVFYDLISTNSACGVLISDATDTTIDGCFFFNIDGSAASGIDSILVSTRVKIVNNNIKNIGTSVSDQSYGIYFEDADVLTAEKNIIHSVGRSAAANNCFGILVAPTTVSNNLKIDGNQIENVLSSSASFGVSVDNGCISSSISENTIKTNQAASYGIRIAGATVGAVNTSKLSIKNNNISTDTVDYLYSGIYLNGLNNTHGSNKITVTGNDVTGFTQYGVYILGDIASAPHIINVSDNFISTTCNPYAALQYGIRLEHVGTVKVNNNEVIMDTSSSGQSSGGIFLQGGQYRGIISNNMVYVNIPSAAAYGIDSSQLATFITGNYIYVGTTSDNGIRTSGNFCYLTNNFYIAAPGTVPHSIAGSLSTDIQRLAGANNAKTAGGHVTGGYFNTTLSSEYYTDLTV